MSLDVVLILAKQCRPDEMPPYAEFHLGTHCLPMYLFTCIQNEKGLTMVKGASPNISQKYKTIMN